MRGVRFRLTQIINQLEIENCQLLKEKITLQEEIDFCKTEVGKFVPQIKEI